MRRFLLLTGFWLCYCRASVVAAQPPNLLLILVDDLRADALGHAGHPFFKSPHIDRLAAEGARFADAFVITSLCSPSRATLLTGLYTHEHAVWGIWQRLDPNLPTVPRALRAAGYETAWVGKWHLDATDAPNSDFDHWVSFLGQGSYADPMLNVDGESIRYDGHMTDALTEAALAYLQRPRERPFFLGISHLAAHAPYLAQHRFHGDFDDKTIRAPESAREDRALKPAYLECRRTKPEELLRAVRGYFELLSGVDESVGKILAALEQSGELDDTLIVFTSDNGYFLGEHGLSDKRAAYEESIRIPLIVRYPAWFAKSTVVRDNLALNLDVGRTLLDAAGLPPLANMRGHSLRDLAQGSARRDRFYYVYYQENSPDNPRANCTPSLVALRTLTEKLIVHPLAEEPIEIYDLSEDPHEMRNLVLESPRREALLEALTAEADSVGSTLLRPYLIR